uniref:Uncharacterized protein n=1 Tax=Roseihalotalea indica TaxID=2867963 RepID=A0AA49GQA2_9BACT|nr:hypothetical protein K4G66_09710 [Tunicatimonas sp. TK19036]
MKAFISLATGISLLYLVGCQKAGQDSSLSDNETSISGVDTTVIDSQPFASSDINQTSAVDTTATNEEAEEKKSTTAQTNTVAEEDTANSYIETEVVDVDTVAMNVAYDVSRRTIEQVDTIGATTTYEVERKVIKRRVYVDTVTETVSKEQQVNYEKGDYKVLSEEVQEDTVTKTYDNPTKEQIKAIRDSANNKLEDELETDVQDVKEAQMDSANTVEPNVNELSSQAKEESQSSNAVAPNENETQPANATSTEEENTSARNNTSNTEEDEPQTSNPATMEEVEPKTEPSNQATTEESENASAQNNEKITESEEVVPAEEAETNNQTTAEEDENTMGQPADTTQRNTPSYQPVQQDTVASDTTSENYNN